jgi:hypothetical protein
MKEKGGTSKKPDGSSFAMPLKFAASSKKPLGPTLWPVAQKWEQQEGIPGIPDGCC